MWIEVVIRPEQHDVLTQFFARFPDKILVMREENGTLYYTAHTHDGAEGVPQINFLHHHKLAYINLDNERVQVIKDLFSYGVEVDGMHVASVFFPGIAENRFKVVLKSEEGDTTGTGAMYALRIDDGSQIWYHPLATPASSLIAAGPVIYISIMDGNVGALQASNGSALWHYRANVDNAA
jgi:outer membrane protein assembly factor BamB